MAIMGQLREHDVERIISEKLKPIDERLSNIEELIISGNIRLESFVSQAIEREMVTQDSFDTILNLLIDYGKKKGWSKK